MAYWSNLTADEVLQLLEQGSTNKDWQDSDEESSDGSDVEAGFCGPENDSMDPQQLCTYECVECDVGLHPECFQSYHKSK